MADIDLYSDEKQLTYICHIVDDKDNNNTGVLPSNGDFTWAYPHTEHADHVTSPTTTTQDGIGQQPITLIADDYHIQAGIEGHEMGTQSTCIYEQVAENAEPTERRSCMMITVADNDHVTSSDTQSPVLLYHAGTPSTPNKLTAAFPQNITYNQSVQINNYMNNLGQYCVASAPGNAEIQVSPILNHGQEQHTDSLAGLCESGLEFTRCSTPEYDMALNSLHHSDSPPKPDHSAAANFSAVNLACAYKDAAIHQDSGYVSENSPLMLYHGTPDPAGTPGHNGTKTPEQQSPTFDGQTGSQYRNVKVFPTGYVQQGFPMRTQGFLPNTMFQGYKGTYQMAAVEQAGSPHLNTIYEPMESLRATEMEQAKQHSRYVKWMGLQYESIADHEALKKEERKGKRSKDATNHNDKQKTDNESDTKNVIESETRKGPTPKKGRHNEPLNSFAISLMTAWYETNLDHPYPSKTVKDELARHGGVTDQQVKSWFANKRNRNNNTRPKKIKKALAVRLQGICHELADAENNSIGIKDNAYFIEQLSNVIHISDIPMKSES